MIEEVYGIYTDTVGNLHWTGTATGHHEWKLKNDELNGRKDIGMNNLDYVRTLSAEELYKLFYVDLVEQGKNFTNSRLFVIDWLNATREECISYAYGTKRIEE